MILLSELKQQLLQDIIVLSHEPKVRNSKDLKLSRTTTITTTFTIKIQCLDTMLLAAKTVKIISIIFLICPANSLKKLLNILKQLVFSQIPINKNQ